MPLPRGCAMRSAARCAVPTARQVNAIPRCSTEWRRNLFDNAAYRDPFAAAGETDRHAMPQHRRRQRQDIVDRWAVAAIDQRARTAGEHQRLAGRVGLGPPPDKAGDPIPDGIGTARAHQRQDRIDDTLADRNPAHQPLRCDQLGDGHRRARPVLGDAGRRDQHFPLGIAIGTDLMKTVLAPAFKARLLGVSGWYSTNILGNRDGEVLDDPESFKTKEESKLGSLEYIFQPELYPDLYKNIFHKVRINYYPPRGDNKEGWDNIDIFGWLGYPMQIKVDFLCRDSILAAPIALDLVLFLDLAKRTPELASIGIQEWLSFYLKSPQTREGLYPEHDLFIQSMKLKNTLRHIMGADLITHLGLEYYD